MRPGGKLSKAALARASERLRYSNPINHFGFVLEKAERGHAVFRMPVLDLHKQIHRVVHGGGFGIPGRSARGFTALLSAPVRSAVASLGTIIPSPEAIEHAAIQALARR